VPAKREPRSAGIAACDHRRRVLLLESRAEMRDQFGRRALYLPNRTGGYHSSRFLQCEPTSRSYPFVYQPARVEGVLVVAPVSPARSSESFQLRPRLLEARSTVPNWKLFKKPAVAGSSAALAARLQFLRRAGKLVSARGPCLRSSAANGS